MKLLPCICFTLILLMPGQAAWCAPSSQYTWSDVERIVAVGDIHGAYAELVSLLQGADIVDEQLNWIGGQTHFVSAGDLLDRGPDSKLVLDLLIKLQPQAASSGGAVHVVLGNHEIMNLTGDLRDASTAELESHGGLDGHKAAFAPSGVYGAWLLQQPSLIKLNDILFVHGGLSSITWDKSLVTLNKDVTTALTTVLTLGAELRAQSLLPLEGDLMDPTLIPDPPGEAFTDFVDATNSSALGRSSLQWYRGNAECHPLIEQPRLLRALQQLQAARVVVGHTPTTTREVRTRFDGRVTMIDTGMLQAFYKGNPRALVIERTQNQWRVIDANGAQQTIAAEQMWAAQAEPTFVAMNKKQAGRALAAHKLDRQLGLHFTPVTTKAPKGINLRLGRSLAEAVRFEKQLIRPNYCEHGSAYELLAAFDALIGKFDRGAENLHYDPRTWNIIALENHLAFGTGSQVPVYNIPVKLAPQLKLALEALTAEDLYTQLDGLLSKREVRALLKRRDQIITWPAM